MTVWRISIVYILSLLFVGLLVPYNDPRLVGGSYGAFERHGPSERMLTDLACQMPTPRLSSSFSTRPTSQACHTSSMQPSRSRSSLSECLAFTPVAEHFSLCPNKDMLPSSSATSTRLADQPGLYYSSSLSSPLLMPTSPMSVHKFSTVSSAASLPLSQILTFIGDRAPCFVWSLNHLHVAQHQCCAHPLQNGMEGTRSLC